MYEADHSRGHYWSILVTVVQSCTNSIDSWAQGFDMTTMDGIDDSNKEFYSMLRESTWISDAGENKRMRDGGSLRNSFC